MLERLHKLLVGFCVNNPDNGCDTGECDAVQVSSPQFDKGDMLLDLHGGPLRFRRGAGWIKVGRRRFKADFSVHWYGNWCWDAWRMGRVEAARLVVYLRERGFACEGSDDQCGDLYDAKAPQAEFETAFLEVQRDHARTREEAARA